MRYTLDGNALKKEHIVKNTSDSVMYYEVGGHDAYTLCWEDGEKITDYYVEFEGTDALSRIVTDENVMLTADRVSVPLTDGRLPISRELFANDAVMTEGLPFRTATIASSKNHRRVTMDFTDFDYFAVWSPYKDFEVPFVCLEPWSTLPDGNHLDHAIEHKHLQGEPESAAHRDAEGAASGHCRRSQRLSAYGGDGVELSGYRRLRSRLCRILSAGVWRGQAVPLLSRARGTVRVYGAQSQLHPISSERGMRRRTSVYREQGDRPALHLYALPAEHRRTGRWQRYRRFLLQLWQPQLRAYLHQLVRFAAKLITAADRSCPIGLGQHCQRSTYGRSRVVAPTASSEAKASRHRQTACTQ